MKLLVAAPRGFCAGVDRAIEIVEKCLEKYGKPVYVRHEIVHNKYVVESLERKGAIFVEELSECPKNRPVIFSAHGVAKSVFSALGIEPSIEYIPTPLSLRGSYQYFTQANMQRINEAGYKFKTTSLELGIKKYVQDYLCQSDPYR